MLTPQSPLHELLKAENEARSNRYAIANEYIQTRLQIRLDAARRVYEEALQEVREDVRKASEDAQ